MSRSKGTRIHHVFGASRAREIPPPARAEVGAYSRLLDFCITPLLTSGPSSTCNERNQEEKEVHRGVCAPVYQCTAYFTFNLLIFDDKFHFMLHLEFHAGSLYIFEAGHCTRILYSMTLSISRCRGMQIHLAFRASYARVHRGGCTPTC